MNVERDIVDSADIAGEDLGQVADFDERHGR
jgi:hypothetical protein